MKNKFLQYLKTNIIFILLEVKLDPVTKKDVP